MRTRCPACSTTFRVTPEQLRLKAGKVRCGHCQSVFNAFESLAEEELAVAESMPAEIVPVAPPAIDPLPAIKPEPVVPLVFDEAHKAPEANILPPSPDPLVEPEPVFAPAPEPRAVVEDPADESIEQSTRAAREAGLMAARELAETSAYNRWAAGTLAGQGSTLGIDENATSSWPFVFMAALLIAGLAVQAAYHYRTDVVLRFPETAALFQSLAVDVPLPRNSDLVSIEASDLQADNARGMLVLQATLYNRAGFAQAWPHLELTLTDARDAVISRRVMAAGEYLPPATDLTRFAARGEVGLRLWLEAKGVEPAGYRLYVFYP